MVACALTCKAWYHRSWFYLLGDLHIRDRSEVLQLHSRLRAEPRLGTSAKFATITGSEDTDARQRLLHLGTFAMMLARYLHKLETISVRDSEWTRGAVQVDHVRCLGAFASLVSLCVSNVVFASVSQLASLISAVPTLVHLRCDNLQCKQTATLPPVPLNARGIRTIALFGNLEPPVLEFISRLSHVAQLELLDIGTSADLWAVPDSMLYDLIKARATPLQRLRLSLAVVDPRWLEQIGRCNPPAWYLSPSDQHECLPPRRE